MSGELFDDVLVPVASEEDARTTMRATLPRLEAAGGSATVVHVIEKAGGAMDKASVEQRERVTKAMFDVAREMTADTAVELRTEVRYGEDIAETVFETADEIGSSAVVFVPREGGRLRRFLTGDVALSLVTSNQLPVVVLPDEEPT